MKKEGLLERCVVALEGQEVVLQEPGQEPREHAAGNRDAGAELHLGRVGREPCSQFTVRGKCSEMN